MSDRFTLLYRFSTDYGLTWTDLTPQVDSRQTVITQNLCTNNFTSAKDEATFVMPETPLFEPDGVTPTPKKLLIDALMGNNDILIEINAPGSVDVLWDGDDVLWNDEHVQWRGSVRYFTGYADRSSMDLRSYPLPPRFTVKVQDVSVLHLDDKVDRNVLLENKKISQIVSALLGYAGYVDIGNTSLDNSDDETLEAFVIDKDNARTYRQYIDDLLFEAGGYVLDFNESGQANVIHLQWDGSASASRTIDNPMNSDGVTLKGAWLKEDGVKIKWSSLAWAYGERIWQADISQEIDSGVLVGETVHSGRYWPDGGELDPVYMEYDAKLLDSEYLTRASRRENKDLTVIMAKNMSARIDAMQNGSPFTGWTRVDPVSWPAGDNWNDKYGIPTNPAYWPTKAWHLLYNGTGSDVSLTFFALYGDVLYRDRVNTVEMSGSKNPKEYESTYIYNQTHAERFAQFWWHFLQTSRYQFTWSEPNRRSPLNDIVAVGVKGSGSTQKALIAGKTHRWINDNVEIISYTAVGIDTYSPASLVPISIVPSSSKPQKQPTTGAKTATFSTTPSYILAQWESFGTPGMAQTWTVTNASAFSVGDIAVINGTISDMDGIPVELFLGVTAVDTVNGTISGNGIEIRYVPVVKTWDFEMSQTSATTDRRLSYGSTEPYTFTKITLTAIKTGNSSILPKWTCTGTKAFFVNPGIQTTSGDTADLIIPKDETADTVQVTMTDYYNPGNPTITKGIAIVDQTEYDHDFGLWTPEDDGTNAYVLPDHITVGTEVYDILEGDFFVSRGFSTSGTAVGSPSGNPHANGYYERGGAGTSLRPYYYFLSSDTSVDGGKTYYTPAGDDYPEGIPYIYESNSWHNAMTATQANSHRLLACLGNVMNSGIAVPSAAALWGWFRNLVAQDAVIGNLVAQDAFIEQLNGTNALFDGIHITGDSQFDGEISNDAFETFGASSPATYAGTFSTSIQTGTIKPNATSSTGDHCKAYCVPRSEIISAFGSNELTKVACTGTAVIDGVTYTGTAENPIYITLQFHWYTNELTLKIQYGRTIKSWSEEDPFFDFPNGYCSSATVSEYSTPTSGNLASVNLTAISSLGGAYTHDLLAKSHLVDSLGSDGIRYKDVFAGTSNFPGIHTIAMAENAQGYSRLPNGLILKWGVAKTTYNSLLRHTIPLTEPFPNTLEFFQVFPIGGSYTESGMEWMYSTASQLHIGKMYARQGNELTSGQRVFFIALGT